MQQILHFSSNLIKPSPDPHPLLCKALIGITSAILNTKQFETMLKLTQRYELHCWVICNTKFLNIA